MLRWVGLGVRLLKAHQALALGQAKLELVEPVLEAGGELLGFPGELFMRLLRALVLPLVSVSMVCGVLALSEKTSAAGARRAVGRLIGSYVLTTLVACFIGLVVVHVVRPGVGVALDASKCVDSNAASGSGGADANSADGETTNFYEKND